MKVVVDRDLCQGHAMCELEAPDVFSVDKKGNLTVLDESPPSSLRSELEKAARFCPTHALTIEEG
ncbi:MAG TPA: ferredoxin [Mycobacteriales bacterium]|nr:ferredoxin [Mycobacteriales bacterium]